MLEIPLTTKDLRTTMALLRDRPTGSQAEKTASADQSRSRWLEWKSRLDVAKAEGTFAVPKAILGFANWMPDVAAQWAEGHGYLLVGVEDEALHGVTTDDIE